MKIIEMIVNLWALVSIPYVIYTYLFRKLREYKSILDSIYDKRPLNGSTFKKIQVLNIPISQISVTDVQSRYTKEDVEEYISRLENIQDYKILKYYPIKDLILKLYELKNFMQINDAFKIKFSSAIISQMSVNPNQYNNLFSVIKTNIYAFYLKKRFKIYAKYFRKF